MRQTFQETTRKEMDLIRRCLATLHSVLAGAEIKFKQAAQAENDGELTLGGTWGVMAFTVESKARVTQTTIRPLVAQMKRWKRIADPLLMSELIAGEAASILRAEKINFVDAAGNVYLNSPPLFVWRQGFKSEMPAHRPTRLFQPVGLKFLSVLLWEPQRVNATYRDLAKRSGVSPAALVPVFEDLANSGFLLTIKKKRQLVRHRELLEQWVLGYAGQLFPRLILKTCRLAQGRTIESLQEDLRWARFPGQVLLGGEVVAGIATGYLRPARAAIHLAPEEQPAWMSKLKLIPDPGGSVDLIQRFSKDNQWTDPPPQLQGIQCANPVLLYGELLRNGADERLRETADILFQKFIAPRYGKSG